jgi:predicted TIM-barrel fold metal-dependent hydrolase
MIDGDELLLFSSDYPHWDADEPDSVGLRAFPDEWKQKVYWENARRLYRLDDVPCA